MYRLFIFVVLFGLHCLKAILRSFCGLDFAFKLKFMYVVLKSAFSSRCDDLCIFCVCVGFLKVAQKLSYTKIWRFVFFLFTRIGFITLVF